MEQETKPFLYEKRSFQCHVVCDTGDFLHMHNEVELFFVMKGAIKISHHFAEYIAHEGEFALICPNTLHAAEHIGETQYLLCIFDKDTFPDLSAYFAHNMRAQNPILPLAQLHPEVALCLEQILSRPELHCECNRTKAYLSIILEHLLQLLPCETAGKRVQQEWIYALLEYLNNHYTEPLTLTQIAKELGVNKYYLSRTFNERIGSSVVDYVNRLRIQKACDLLRKRTLPITQIAYACGFSSLTSFFRVFKSLHQCTPKEYRARYGA